MNRKGYIKLRIARRSWFIAGVEHARLVILLLGGAEAFPGPTDKQLKALRPWPVSPVTVLNNCEPTFARVAAVEVEP